MPITRWKLGIKVCVCIILLAMVWITTVGHKHSVTVRSTLTRLDFRHRGMASLAPNSVSEGPSPTEALSSATGHELALRCSELNITRYGYLQTPLESSKPSYFFALDIHQAAHILPQLLSAIIEAMEFLGLSTCTLSIVEGRSNDGTIEILKDLAVKMQTAGIQFYLQSSSIDPLAGDSDRIAALAELRNLALLPLLRHPRAYDSHPTIVFLNDVSLCAEDILELLHQLAYQSADMVCAMDWIEGGRYFYDVWIGRQMNGDLFFETPNGSWDFAEYIFWNDELSRYRYDHGKPIQVFSCWNGAVALKAEPLTEGKIRFRRSRTGECNLGEPVHLCQDMWEQGYRRIAVIPSVNIGYSDEESWRIKDRHGSVSSWTRQREHPLDQIIWTDRPPTFLKCVPDFKNQSWIPFN